MVKYITTALVAAITLTGCARSVYLVKPDGNNSAFYVEKAQCEYQANLATQTVDYSLRSDFSREMDRAMRRKDLTLQCMLARGWVAQR